MDLATLIADKPLLASLSREYESLKGTNECINWEQWITQRLKNAAATRASNSVTQAHLQQQQRQHKPHQGSTQAVHGALRQAPAQFESIKRVAASARKDTGPDQRIPAVTKDWQARDTTNTQQAAAEGQLHARLAHTASRSSSHKAGLLSSPTWSFAEALAGEGSGPYKSSSQPQWVAAAKLQSTLQASKVVPTMHAAADRERRLAAAAALARQATQGLGEALLCSQLPPASRHLEMSAAAAAAAAQQQQQLQQVVELTQQVAQQNQLLQQAVQQQQEQLHQHQGLLATALHQAAAAPQQQSPNLQHGQAAVAAATPAGAVAAAAPPAPAPAAAGVATVPTAVGVPSCQGSAAGSGSQLPPAALNSWLVTSVMREAAEGSKAAAAKKVSTDLAPDFIRIAGAARQPVNKQQEQQQGQENGAGMQNTKQQQELHSPDADAAAAAARRSHLKVALKQLLSRGGAADWPHGIAGLLQSLTGLQSSAQQHQQNSVFSNNTDAQLQYQQQQRGAQLSKAQQLVLQRRKQQAMEQQQQKDSGTGAAAGGSEGAQGGGRPAWQSEIYVPPPSHLLRRKAGMADAWNAATADKPAAQRRSAVGGVGGSSSKKSGAGASGARRKTSTQRATAAVRVPAAAGAAGARARRPVLSSTRPAQSSLQTPALDGRHSSSSNSGLQQPTGPWGQFEGDDSRRPQVVFAHQRQQQELVDQPVQSPQELCSSEQLRLGRVEEATSHILQAVARLEQQLQQKPSSPATPGHGPKAKTEAAWQPPKVAAAIPQPAATTSAAADADAVQLSPSTMASLLSTLERVETQEKEIRDRWFSNAASDIDGRGSSSDGGSRKSREAAVTSMGSKSHAQDPAPSLGGSPSTADAADAATAATSTSSDVAGSPRASTHTHTHLQPQQEQHQQDLNQGYLTDAAVKSIKAGRHRFLKHRALLDGALEGLSQAGTQGSTIDGSNGHSRRRGRSALQPTQVIEAVADLLLDELLLEQAADLDGFCDAVCNGLFDDEFEEA